MEGRWSGMACVAVLCGLVLACGDAATSDGRGYTKAPLEEPGLTVQPEATTEMVRFGEADVPDPPLEPPTDSAG